MFKIYCPVKAYKADFERLKPFCQSRYKEMPISRNKSVQTGAKTQPGGLKLGLFNVKYQLETDLAVKNEPIMPANWQIIIDVISLNQFIFSIKMPF